MPCGTGGIPPSSTGSPTRFRRRPEAVYSPAGKVQVKEYIDFYLNNAKIVRQTMTDLGFDHVGGENSPYIWIDGQGRDSWAFFDLLLNKASVVCTPGAGFGRCGSRYIRISAFNSPGKRDHGHGPDQRRLKMNHFFKVKSLDQVFERVREFSPPLEPETLPLEEARARVLAQDVQAFEDMPGFRRATMDGYAVAAQSTFGGLGIHTGLA